MLIFSPANAGLGSLAARTGVVRPHLLISILKEEKEIFNADDQDDQDDQDSQHGEAYR